MSYESMGPEVRKAFDIFFLAQKAAESKLKADISAAHRECDEETTKAAVAYRKTLKSL